MRAITVFFFATWDSLVSLSRSWLPYRLGGDSIIPQFILDARHPWVEANRDQLESTPNVAAYLCGVDPPLLSLGDTNLTIPPDLFHRLEINNNRAGIHRYGWRNAHDRLVEMRSCTAALQGVEKLDVDIYVHEGREPDSPSRETIELFAEVLESMTNLSSVIWDMPCKQTPRFGEVFTAARGGGMGMKLATVRELTVGPFSEYLVPLCPNLMTIAYSRKSWHCDWTVERERGDSRELLVRAAAGNKHVASFRMAAHWGGWTPGAVEGIVRAMPNLSHLAIHGRLRMSDTSYYEDIDRERRGDGGVLQTYLKIVSKLPNLRHLELPESSELDLGFYGWEPCGNAYFGQDGRRLGRDTAKESALTTEKAGVIVIGQLPGLEKLHVDGYRANITTNDDGTVELTWPWTGRLDEWAYEEYPDWPYDWE